MGQKRSVGLVVVTDIPNMGRVAVLNRRGDFNYETMKPESYPGGCQVTVHGKAEENEEITEALKREELEELGELGYAFDSNKFIELSRLESEDKLIVTYGIYVPPESFPLVFLSANQVEGIQDLRTFDKKEGVTDRRVVAMFLDEKEAIRLAFEKLR
ncbi:MAG: hypothetical protein HYT03_02280 [Candidatus Harrisonbacteria bacterium]|nr:hypothetical protein [Candidatus Harrisonbacteria bacterium]